MQLEQIMYPPVRMQRTGLKPRQRVYISADLESLSASALYTGDSFLDTGGGFVFQPLQPLELVYEPISVYQPPKPESLRVVGSPTSLKIFSSDGGAPLVRIDYKQHEQKPPMHLQYGISDYTERTGDEAAEIFGEILRLNTKIKFSNDE
jgi:hypothetical protein